MTTKVTSETMPLRRCLRPSHKLDIIYTDGSKEFIEARQDLQWNQDTSTPHRSETNGVAERAVRRVKEGKAIALVHSGLPEEWWDRAMECCCYLRNVHDKMADGKTAFEQRDGRNWTDHQSVWNIG